MTRSVQITIPAADDLAQLSSEPIRLPSPYDLARDYARQVFEATGRNMSASARIMGMHRRTLQRMLRAGERTNG